MTVRVVHYLNQFFAGLGGEDTADTAPASASGAVGPGRKLQQLLGDDYEIVTTVWCGDDHAGGPEVIDDILGLIRAAEPDVVVTGPAFTSGRYGLACARVASATAAAGIASVACMHPDNPGIDEAGPAPVVASGEVARQMGPSLETLAAAVRKVAAGEALGAGDGRVGAMARLNVTVEDDAAQRAVSLVLARLGGDTEATEVPLPRFEQVTPAPPVDDVSTAVVALVTEGALVPDDNPGSLESARATRWLRYPIKGKDRLPAGEYRSVHGGFSTVAANADPHRIVPLDVARQLEDENVIGRVHDEYLVTAGNGTSIANAMRFGQEWAVDLRKQGVQAALLTAT